MIDRIPPGPYGQRNHFLERVLLQRAEEQSNQRAACAIPPSDEAVARRKNELARHATIAGLVRDGRARGETWKSLERRLGLTENQMRFSLSRVK